MGIVEMYNHVIRETSDQRTLDWFLMGSPFPILILFAGYLYFVLRCGPRYIENRPPYSLKTFIKFYNIFQIVVNALAVYFCLHLGFLTEISLGCEPIDYSLRPRAVQLAGLFWWVMMLKIVDLIETAVFIFRKKTRQVSFLHLYHHISTIFVAWLTVKYFAGGMAIFSLFVNCIVHVIMYTYYFASTCGPAVQRAVSPIKPYITIIQMVQFFIILFHTLQAYSPTCYVPKWGANMLVANLVMNFFLFYNFYRKTYKKKTKNQ